ncbi:MAG: nucleotidyl transferase AbiEii/AbiGii toxin family protein [Spirochaetes bacterium]|nr:MAG: nucleotidyl transferase AbiEii/AbiGii toxin family protein [Spirochaetota bacterium]
MHSAIQSMIESYHCKTITDYKNALKEIIQEIALLGLYRGGFFNEAAFYGGTSLRLFYGLDRFSEDLDFSLIAPNPQFDLSAYTKVVQDELGAYGMEMTVTEKIKRNDSAVKSAFIKGGTHMHLLKIAPIMPLVSGVHPDEYLQIKLEVDTDPPDGALYEVKYQLLPVPYYVRIYAPSSLFAGKVHALLCRGWRTRVKGRDFYDYIWYLSKGIPLNIAHLTSRMRQTGHLKSEEVLDEADVRERLDRRFDSVDFQQAKTDIRPFIKNPDSTDLWSKEFFSAVTKEKLTFDRPNI